MDLCSLRRPANRSRSANQSRLFLVSFFDTVPLFPASLPLVLVFSYYLDGCCCFRRVNSTWMIIESAFPSSITPFILSVLFFYLSFLLVILVLHLFRVSFEWMVVGCMCRSSTTLRRFGLFYCLLLFYWAAQEEMQPVRPLPKFICV